MKEIETLKEKAEAYDAVKNAYLSGSLDEDISAETRKTLRLTRDAAKAEYITALDAVIALNDPAAARAAKKYLRM